MVKAERVERHTEPDIMKPNCLKKVPWVPEMKVTGINTATNTNEVEIAAAVTSWSASLVADAAVYFPVSIFVITASTTTMASSTTVPMANTKANSVIRLSE